MSVHPPIVWGYGMAVVIALPAADICERVALHPRGDGRARRGVLAFAEPPGRDQSLGLDVEQIGKTSVLCFDDVVLV